MSEKCPTCDGAAEPNDCSLCNGTGWSSESQICPYCDEGKVYRSTAAEQLDKEWQDRCDAIHESYKQQLADKERRITTLKHDRKMLLDTLNSLCNKVEEMKLQGG